MECGSCTLCCTLLELHTIPSKIGVTCEHCDPEKGCTIYHERPEECSIFECAWKQMESADIGLRPDNCGALFEKWTDSVMVGTTDTGLSALLQEQIDFFRGEGISIIFLDHVTKSKIYFLAPGHTKKFVKGEINDSSKLHNRLN